MTRCGSSINSRCRGDADGGRRVPVNMRRLRIDSDTVLDAVNIGSGLFAPLEGFLTGKEYRRVVNDMRLLSGEPWALPVTLDAPAEEAEELAREARVALVSGSGEDVAVLEVKDVFEIDIEADVERVFGTADIAHPGVRKEISRSRVRIGGRLSEVNPPKDEFGDYILTPKMTRRLFREKGWKTIAGFQTRNPIHRAHEYLQRLTLKITDGLFVNPLIGWKKTDDFSPAAILGSYDAMIKNGFYPSGRVVFGILRTPMRYAGPREAVFHAQVRKNYGCTHFVVGRDHAGVGGFYGKYDAHRIFSEVGDLGIEIIKLFGPFYCCSCGDITTEDVCRHKAGDHIEVSGTVIRELIRQGKRPPEEMMRKEVADALIALNTAGKAFFGV